MPYGLYISAEGAMAQSRRLETLANNLANVDTVGFKRHLANFQARPTAAIERGLQAPGMGDLGDIGGGVMLRNVTTDFSSGTLKYSGIPTDFVIEGEGFFAVQKGKQTFLTRAGNFSIAPNGQLVTQQGYPVLSEAGTPVALDPEGGPWQLQSDGTILQDGEQQAIAIIKPRSLGDLANAAENLFLPLGPVGPVEAETRSIKQYFIEQSGVQPTQEMMELIETSRVFESNVNMIRNQDQMLGQLVSRVMKSN
jgi:flagellar basal-body rod protein FlgF/flagellar basal-body rod protein FlgG